jgi:hypothetical protein
VGGSGLGMLGRSDECWDYDPGHCLMMLMIVWKERADELTRP